MHSQLLSQISDLRSRRVDDYTEAENLDASSKMWSVYVGEAERYDKRLVESWKGDMDGMLIFVRLQTMTPSTVF